MKIVTTFDGKTVCDVMSWPPRQNDDGRWELAVRGETEIFDLLSEYRGCSFRVGELEFHNLLFVRREIFPPEDEAEFPTMVFAEIHTWKQPVRRPGDPYSIGDSLANNEPSGV